MHRSSSAPQNNLSDGRPHRRDFLKASAAGLAAFAVPPMPTYAQAQIALASYEPRYLSSSEWKFVTHAVSRLIPSDGDGPGAIEALVPVFIDRELAGDYGAATDWYMVGPHLAAAPPEFGWQSPLSPAELYRAAIRAIDAWCEKHYGAHFSALAASTQDAVLTALEKGELPLPSELRDFFEILLANTKEGYFSDPIHGGNDNMVAWVYIGFPGARAHYKDWVARHNIRYTLGPVSISGERA